jgi:IS1 family transposase
MGTLPFHLRVQVIGALVEGNSIRSTERLTGVHRDTIMRLGVTVGKGCAQLHDELVRNIYAHMIELDEVWAFVGKKERHVTQDDPLEYGDNYTFTALDANTKLVISYVIGRRTPETTYRHCADLNERVLGKPQINTDGYPAYIRALRHVFGDDMHHGVAVKQFANSADNTTDSRYSPGRVVGIQRSVISGTPNIAQINTNHSERQNLTMRMHIRRLTRLTNAYSKKKENLDAAIALHFAVYNFCRVHETLRVTPAMQAGIARTVWSIADLLQAIVPLPSDDPETTPQVTQPMMSEPVCVKSVFRVIQGGKH